MKEKAEDRVRRDPELKSVRIETFRSGGPGGQHQNKTSSGVRVRVRVDDAVLLTRLKQLFPGSVTDTGELLSKSTAQPKQARNRDSAFSLLERKLKTARRPVKPRKKTRPKKSANEKRLTKKKQQSQKKQSRRKPHLDD